MLAFGLAARFFVSRFGFGVAFVFGSGLVARAFGAAVEDKRCERQWSIAGLLPLTALCLG